MLALLHCSIALHFCIALLHCIIALRYRTALNYTPPTLRRSSLTNQNCAETTSFSAHDTPPKPRGSSLTNRIMAPKLLVLTPRHPANTVPKLLVLAPRHPANTERVVTYESYNGAETTGFNATTPRQHRDGRHLRIIMVTKLLVLTPRHPT